MSCIYFSIPVVGGWNVMQWAIGRAHESIGEKGEKLKVKKVEGIGNTSVVNGEKRTIGAGGMGMGVKLALSDEQDQERSKKMLAKMLKKARKQKMERDAELENNSN